MEKKLQAVREASGGRPAKISREQILEEARRLPAGELTTYRLAERLGVKPQALYYHFKSRDELLNALAIELVKDFDLQPGDSKKWRPWMQETALRFFDFLVANPSVLEYSNWPGLAKFGLPLMEAVLKTLKGAGYSVQEAGQLWELVGSLVFAKARLLTDAMRLGPVSGTYDIDEMAGQSVPLTRAYEAKREQDARKYVAGLLRVQVAALPRPRS